MKSKEFKKCKRWLSTPVLAPKMKKPLRAGAVKGIVFHSVARTGFSPLRYRVMAKFPSVSL
jgi:hypothetical protein